MFRTMVHRRPDTTIGKHVNRNNEASSPPPSPSPSTTTTIKSIKVVTGTPVGRFASFLGSCLFVGLFVLLVSSSGHKGGGSGNNRGSLEKSFAVGSPLKSTEMKSKSATGNKKIKQKGPPPPMWDYPVFEPAFAKYEKCQVKWTPPPPKTTWDTKPLWLSGFPGAGSTSPASHGDIMRPLINGITGLQAGAKFYHASSKILKRCKGTDETATCSNGHPIVDIGPQGQKDNFYHSVILLMRNFKTTFPVYHNDKAEAYHGAKGQLPVNEWRKSRDQWYKDVMEGWKHLTRTWKNMTEYDIGAYVQYEELMDHQRGPLAVERIANLLQSAGFTVAPKEDLPCIWFQSVKDEYLRLQNYVNYTFGYTEEQRAYMLQEMQKFQAEMAGDKALAVILQEYFNDIKDHTYIDIPYQEEAAAAEGHGAA